MGRRGTLLLRRALLALSLPRVARVARVLDLTLPQELGANLPQRGLRARSLASSSTRWH